METVCNKPIGNELVDKESTELQLKPFNVATKSVAMCWQQGIYLPQLFIRFFKLTLQIISRVSSWTEEVSEPKNWPKSTDLKRIDFLVTLYLDVITFEQKIPKIINVVVENVPVNLNAEIPLLTDSLKESQTCLNNCLGQLEGQWQSEILAEISGWAKQVADIPRLYRKTNREAPTRACNYVEQILRPAQAFHQRYSGSLKADVMQSCLRNVFSQLALQ